jgi:uncharacterized protein (TIGR00730 family)
VKSVCVFLSSSPGQPAFVEAIKTLGAELARRRYALVYGGAARGLMGTLADSALAGGARVVGVIPRALVDQEVAHVGLTEIHIVETMHARKAMMYALSDAFVVAPGGFGTLEEAFEILTAIQIGYHAKPIVFLDVDGFWDRLGGFLDHAVVAGVLRPDVRRLFRVASSPSAALDAIGPAA